MYVLVRNPFDQSVLSNTGELKLKEQKCLVTARTRIALAARIGAKNWPVRWSNDYSCCAHSDRVRCIP